MGVSGREGEKAPARVYDGGQRVEVEGREKRPLQEPLRRGPMGGSGREGEKAPARVPTTGANGWKWKGGRKGP